MKRFIASLIIMSCLCCLTISCSIIMPLIGNDLPIAIQLGNYERVKEAVDNGANVNKSSILYALHETPLLYSINNGQNCIPEYLLSVGADPNYIDKRNGISLLMYAVGANAESGITYGNATDNDVYKVLLNDQRTDVNLTGKLGYTALDYACRDNGRWYIVTDLVNHGAKITAATMKCAVEGYKSMHCEESVIKLVFNSLAEQKIPSGLEPDIEAAIQGDSEQLIALKNVGRIKQENKQIVLMLTCAFGDAKALKALADVNDENDWSKYYLGIACSYGKLETVEYLLNEHADIEILSDDFSTGQIRSPLTYALQYNRLDIADYLFERGASLQMAGTGTSGNRADALEMACKSGNIDTVKWVVAHGYPLGEERFEKAMTKAAQHNHIDVLNYFFKDLKADINAEYYHSTVLVDSIWSASFETIEFLVESGANVNGGKDHIFTPLDSAVSRNRADVVLYLISKGADVNLTDGTSDRPLTRAIQNGYFDIVKILVEHGGDLNYKEGWTDGKDTPLEIAEKERSQRIIDYIKANA